LPLSSIENNSRFDYNKNVAIEKNNTFHISHPWRWGAAVVILAALVYLPILGNGFVYDDHFMEKNRAIRDFSNIPSFFTTHLWAFFDKGDLQNRQNLWRPLPMVSWAIAYKISGTNPWGFHLLSLLLHALCTLLVFVAGRELLKQDAAVIAAAALFAVHPVHVDAVAWASSLADLLMTLFSLAALIAYHRFRTRSSMTWGIYTLLFFSLTLLTKESGVMLAPILVVFEFLWHTKEKRHRAIAFFGGIFLLVIVYFVLRHQIMGSLDTKLFDIPFGHLFNTVLMIFGQYARLLLFPLRLQAAYPVQIYDSLLHPDVLVSIFFLALAVVFLVFTLRTRKDVFWLLLIGLPLLPGINIIGFGTDLFNERYLYLPSVGFCFLLAGFFIHHLPRLVSFFSVKQVKVALAVLLCLYTVRVIVRLPDWRDEYTYLTVTLRDAPRAYILHNNMGKYLHIKHRDLAGAEKSFLEAEELAPGYEYAKSNLAIIYLEMGQLQKAYKYAMKALEIRPNWVSPLISAAEAAGRMGQIIRAEELLLKALSLEADNPKIHNNLGNVAFFRKQFKEAVDYWEKAKSLDPADTTVLFNLGLGYEKLAQVEQALHYYREFVQKAPAGLERMKQTALNKIRQLE
jgi:Flp pilus assembly protein TadD